MNSKQIDTFFCVFTALTMKIEDEKTLDFITMLVEDKMRDNDIPNDLIADFKAKMKTKLN